MKKLVLGLAVLLPAVTFANEGINGLFGKIEGWMGQLASLAFAAAVLFFFYHMAMYVWKQGDDKKAAVSGMIWGIVAIFVMTSVYGLVGLLSDSFDLGGEDTLKVPGLPGIDS